ncbi:MAG TPA: hypothetical protein HA283_05535 [Nanoarchaeota archaeon]|nr:hypothetical protein [Nanoarchaeota archaeon]HIH63730.1 hypothetical protein [Nanoarchaeota archaeon]HIJ09603.1 hypothetical protein [Nanoarchaeota archaeon]
MEDIFMKSEIKQRMFFKDLSSKSLANSNLINSKMLNNVVADCGLYVNPNAVKFFRIALSNFEKVLLRNGLDVNEFSVYDFAQTDYGKNLEHYISNYFGCDVKKRYEFVHPLLPKDGFLFFVNNQRDFENLGCHLRIKSIMERSNLVPVIYGFGAVLQVGHY